MGRVTILKYILGICMILFIVAMVRSCHGQDIENGSYKFKAVVNETEGDNIGMYVFNTAMYGQITVEKEEIDKVCGEGFADELQYGDTISLNFLKLEKGHASKLKKLVVSDKNDNIAYVWAKKLDIKYENRALYSLTMSNPEYTLFPGQSVDVRRDSMAAEGEDEWVAFVEDMNEIAEEYDYAAITFTEYTYNEEGKANGFTGIVSVTGVEKEDLPGWYYKNF